MQRDWKEWALRASVRALKTVAQTALGFITVDMALEEIDWIKVASVSLVAGIYSLITSLAGLPELDEHRLTETKEAESSEVSEDGMD